MDNKKTFNQPNQQKWTKTAGDKVERAGEKIADAGAIKLGAAVYKAGNKLEHSQDKKNQK